MSEPSTTPYLRAAFVAGPLAALASLALATVGLLLARGTDLAGPEATARTGAQVWLAALGSGLTVDGVEISIVPVGSVLVAIGAVALVAAWALPDPVDELPAFVISTAAVHAVVGGIVATVAGTGGVEVSTVRAVVATFVVGGAGAALGAVRRHGGGAALWFTVSDEVRRSVRAGLSGVATLLATSAVIVVIGLVRHLDRAGDLWALLDPGLAGGVALAVTSLLAVPTLVLWTASVLLGPGFVLGTDTSVDLTGSQLGAVPGFPALAALPEPGQFAGWAFLLGLLPLAAGAVAGWRADAGGREGVAARVVTGAAAGAVGGFVLGVLVGLSGGSIGPGRMAEAGPSALSPLLVAVPVLAVGGAIGALLAHYRGSRALTSPGTGSAPGSRDRSGRRDAAGGGPVAAGRARVRRWLESAGASRRDRRS